MFFNRLRRLVTATLLLVLPLQGQAVASMNCHSVQGAMAIMASPVPAHGSGHAGALGDVSVFRHGSGHDHLHSHAVSAADSSSAVNSSNVDVDRSPQTSNEFAPTDSCVLCATCCMLSAALPPHALSHTDLFKTPAPGRLSSAMLAGVVPDGLLRPPR